MANLQKPAKPDISARPIFLIAETRRHDIGSPETTSQAAISIYCDALGAAALTAIVGAFDVINP